MGWEKELWPEWQIECDIGSGAYGTVYKIKRQDIGGTYYSALKVISFPQDRTEFSFMQNKHMSDDQISQYYHQMAVEVAREFAVMEKLKGHTNIVTYEDHKIVPHKNGLGWNVLIRMELLKSLPDYLETIEIDEKEVCKLGIDICNALILCEKEKIIHRDIKPGNVFVSEYGDYKLGDFSLAKYVEKIDETTNPHGTYSYMAPEVYRGKRYDQTIDIYSLGLLLYRLLNRGRGPFQPLPPQIVSSDISEAANRKRLCSETLPKPVDASALMSSIILKACAYDPRKRYQNAFDFQKSLIRCSSTQPALDATKHISYYLKKAAAVLQDSYEESVDDEMVTEKIEHKFVNHDFVNHNYENKNERNSREYDGQKAGRLVKGKNLDRRTMDDFFKAPGDL